MAAADGFDPTPADRFTFGLWTVGNRGRDPFGEPVRPRARRRVEIVHLLAEVGAWGVNFHDNDLVPIDATPAERDRDRPRFQARARRDRPAVPMATTNLFTDPVFKDGAFTSNDARRARLRAAEDDARDGSRRRAGRQDLRLLGRTRRRRDGRGERSARRDQALPRGASTSCASTRATSATTCGSRSRPSPTSRAATSTCRPRRPMLAFIATLDDPEMVGVNPEVAHEHMAGLNFLHAVAQALGCAASCFTSISTIRSLRPLRPGLPLRVSQSSSRRSSW